MQIPFFESVQPPLTPPSSGSVPIPNPSPNPLKARTDLPLVRKTQLIALLAFLPLAAIAGLGSAALFASLRSQMLDRANSQLSVAESGFASQSQNPLIVEAARIIASERALTPQQFKQLRALLRDEVEQRQIEYATLVDGKGRIIANANRDRRGQAFDPNNLVSQVLQRPRQIRSSEIVPRSELEREAPRNIKEIASPDALIRYTVTPIQASGDREAIGALISGDIVNEKTDTLTKNIDLRSPIGLSLGLLGLAAALAWAMGRAIAQPIEKLQKATKAFASGNYQARVAINSRDEVGQLAANFNHMADIIETSDRLLRRDAEMFRLLAELAAPQPGEEGDLSELFQRAIAGARETIAADRLAIYQFTPEGVGRIAAEAKAGEWSSALGDSSPDLNLSGAAIERYRNAQIERIDHTADYDSSDRHRHWLERLQVRSSLTVPIFNQGQLSGLLMAHQCSAPRNWQEIEIDFLKQLAIQLQVVLDRVSFQKQRRLGSNLARHLEQLTLQISDAFDAQVLFDRVVAASRQALLCDRCIVYSFDGKGQGTVVAESVGNRFPTALGRQILDPSFAESYVRQYREGRVKANDDIYRAGLTESHLRQVELLSVRANLVAPIIVAGELSGLLIAHHCESPWAWQSSEIDFFTQVSLQVGVALEHADLLERQIRAEAEQRQEKERLQKRALELLAEVDPVSRGDLTIRAQVTEGEMGSLASSYNATVENFHRIVTRVKSFTQQLAAIGSDNANAVGTLTQNALRQAEEIDRTLDCFAAMNRSIQAVSQNAESALQSVQEASETVSAGEIAMNQAVDGMLAIREIVTASARQIHQLDEASQQISKVVSLIGRFAAQTHLLALKASIEAARAGEEGRGFAVIAEEVRTLAAQSAEATAEIATLVLGIQSAARDAATTMNEGTEQVVSGSQLVDETRKSLNKMAAVSSRIDNLVESIVQSTAEQSQTSESLTHVIVGVAEIARHTSGSASGVSAALTTLLEVARDLENSIDPFSV